jgi:hypothetical protein
MATQPAPPPEKGKKQATNQRGHWQEQIAKAVKRWDAFYCDGDKVQDRYMLEGARMDGTPQDKYNILYSSTETIKPSLYAQTPNTQAKVRKVDAQNSTKVYASMLMEQIGDYGIEVTDYDTVLRNAVSDYVLPGLGQAWVRYDPTVSPANDNPDQSYLTFEGLALDYVHYRDFLTGPARVWKEVPWVAKRCFFTKPKATARFGKAKADQLSYSYNKQDKNKDESAMQAVIYEIWDKESGRVYWYSEDFPDDLLDAQDDPLKLEHFFPCPQPLRAVWNTKTFIPKSLYSQYRTQAGELDRLTERIRYLTEALKVRGIYDGSQPQLANVLNGAGNKMIAVENWAAIMGNGGLKGSVDWVPIDAVVAALTELFKQREICKNEIYEITGFSDIVRGTSKASETLGAQQLKADWAGGRLRDMQKEVQRFCRDIIRIMVEIAVTHFNDATLLAYSGISLPEPSEEENAAAAQAMAQGQPAPPTARQQMEQEIQKVFQLIRSEKLRCANIGVETDSTIMPDQTKEREDRMAFLGQIGAFLQQAGPMALQYPDMRGLLGAIMMFTIRTFPGSRPLEKEFEAFVEGLKQQPPTPPPGQDGKQNAEAQAAAQKEIAQLKAQTDTQNSQLDDATKRYEIDKRAETEMFKAKQDHEWRMKQLELDEKRLELEEIRMGVDLEDSVLDRDELDEQRELEKMNTDNDRADAMAEQERQGAIKERELGMQEGMQERQMGLQEQQAEVDMGVKEQQADLAAQQAETDADIQQQQVDIAANPPVPPKPPGVK